jgi:hypothetical protein
VGGGGEIFQLLAGEDIESDDVNLGVTVLASLGGRHINDLAGTTLDDNVTVLSQSGALHGVGRGRTSVGGLEGLMLKRNKCQLIVSSLNKMAVENSRCLAARWLRYEAEEGTCAWMRGSLRVEMQQVHSESRLSHTSSAMVNVYKGE